MEAEEEKKPAAEGCEVEPSSTEKTSTKVEKKRRRSQTSDALESGVPSKIRKTSTSESEEKEKGGAKTCKCFHTSQVFIWVQGFNL